MESSRLELEAITTLQGLEAIRAEWSALWDRCPQASPFLTPEWLLPWYQNLAAPNPLWVHALRRAGRLVGLAPFLLHHWQGRRQVSLLGTGITDCLDVLLEPGAEAEGLAVLFASLAGNHSCWEVCDLEQLPPDSPLLAPLPRRACEPVPEGITATVADHDTRLVVPLPGTVEEYLASVPSWHRRKLRMADHRVARSGTVEYATATAQTLAEDMDALIRLHTARWQAQDLPGMLTSDRLRAFYRQAAAGLLTRGCLALHTLRHNGRMAAALYCLVGHGCCSCYLGGFESELEHLSPGALLLRRVIEQSIQKGYRAVDFLRGQEPYKYRWGVRAVVNRRLVLHRTAAS